jgi:shikimate dehydrogenase
MADSRETLTKKAFVAGYPISHSRSPMIHKYWLKRYGIEGDYEAREIKPENLEGFLGDLKSGRELYVGGNITIPHKEMACSLADSVDDLASEIGAANTLWLKDGKLMATNTDAYGFAANLDERHPGWDRQDAAVVFGAGGASRAIIVALKARGFRVIHVLNRTLEKAAVLADRFGPSVHAHAIAALPDVLKDSSLFVNTTSLGLNGEPVPKIDFSPMKSRGLVTDIVYVPLKTGFMVQAEQQGFATADGLGMLLHQAVPGFEKWFGIRPTVDTELRVEIERAIGVK